MNVASQSIEEHRLRMGLPKRCCAWLSITISVHSEMTSTKMLEDRHATCQCFLSLLSCYPCISTSIPWWPFSKGNSPGRAPLWPRSWTLLKWSETKYLCRGKTTATPYCDSLNLRIGRALERGGFRWRVDILPMTCTVGVCVYIIMCTVYIYVNVWDADVGSTKTTMTKWSVPEQPACGVITRFPIHAVSVHVLRFYIEDNMQNETQTL